MSAFYPHTAYWPRNNRGGDRWGDSASEEQSDEQQSSSHRAIAARDWQLVQLLINQPSFDPEVRDEVSSSHWPHPRVGTQRLCHRLTLLSAAGAV